MTRCAVTVAEFGVNAVVGGGLMKLAEDEGERLGGAGHGAASGAVAQGSATVLFNGRPAARTGDAESCHGGAIVQGSATVLINGRPAARVTDKTSCGASIIEGSPDIRIGGPVETTGPMQSEVPSWARWAAIAAGLLPALGGAAQTGAKAVRRALEARAGGGVLSATTDGQSSRTPKLLVLLSAARIVFGVRSRAPTQAASPRLDRRYLAAGLGVEDCGSQG